MIEKNQIAILFFSLSPEKDAQRKSTLNADVFRTLQHHTSKSLRYSGLQIFHYHEGNQKGATFGEKLSNAYQELFDQGFEAVISVGNDCLGLSDTDWNQTISNLQAHKNVLGPDQRGGAYLIGIIRDSFNKSEFENLPWQSRNLFNALKGSLNIYEALNGLKDINTFRDLQKAIHEKYVSKELKRLFILISSPVKHFYTFIPTFFSRFKNQCQILRAPPLG